MALLRAGASHYMNICWPNQWQMHTYYGTIVSKKHLIVSYIFLLLVDFLDFVNRYWCDNTFCTRQQHVSSSSIFFCVCVIFFDNIWIVWDGIRESNDVLLSFTETQYNYFNKIYVLFWWQIMGMLQNLTFCQTDAWVNNYTHYNMWDEITYPFPNFNVAAVEV